LGEPLIDKETFVKFLEERFSDSSPKTVEDKIIDSIIDLISTLQQNSVGSFLLDCAMMISRQFDFKEIAIGLKDKTDGLYKYGIFLGIMPAAQEALKKIKYTYEDMTDNVKYPDVKIGRFSEYVMTESSETDLRTYNRPGFIGKNRERIDGFVEGDYLDIYMYGGGDELIGWFEISNPKDGKIPDKDKLKWLEFTVSIIARIIWERMYARDSIKTAPL